MNNILDENSIFMWKNLKYISFFLMVEDIVYLGFVWCILNFVLISDIRLNIGVVMIN